MEYKRKTTEEHLHNGTLAESFFFEKQEVVVVSSSHDLFCHKHKHKKWQSKQK